MTNIAAISHQIWDMKYRLKGPDGAPVDRTIDDTWRRVAKALAAGRARAGGVGGTASHDAMRDFRFMPAGRILAGAGADRNVTLFNCFVMGEIPDDMSGIFRQLQEAALTMQQGRRHRLRFLDASSARRAGSRRRRRRLRPALVHGCLGFDVPDHHERRPSPRRDDGDRALRPPGYRSLHRGQARARPACACSTSRCWSPTPSWRPVRQDDPWDLVFGRHGLPHGCRPRALWDTIVRSTYAFAEPGVIFIDRIQQAESAQLCRDDPRNQTPASLPIPGCTPAMGRGRCAIWSAADSGRMSTGGMSRPVRPVSSRRAASRCSRCGRGRAIVCA